MKQCLIILLVFASVSWSTTLVYNVDTDVVGGNADGDGWANAYSSLEAAEQARTADIDTANNIVQFLCRASSGTVDTTACSFSGWTTSVTDYVEVIGYDGTYIHNNPDTGYVYVQTEDIRFTNITFRTTVAGTSTIACVYISSVSTGTIFFDSCTFECTGSGTGSCHGISVNDADITVTAYNCTFAGFESVEDTSFSGVYSQNCDTFNLYNSTIYDCYAGLYRSLGTINIINTAFFGNTGDITGTVTITYSATEDGDAGTGNVTITQTADDYAALVTDAAGGDFSLTNASSQLYNTGDGTNVKSIFTVDIVDVTRGPADADWDIGAYEYNSPSTVAVIQNNYRRRR